MGVGSAEELTRCFDRWSVEEFEDFKGKPFSEIMLNSKRCLALRTCVLCCGDRILWLH